MKSLKGRKHPAIERQTESVADTAPRGEALLSVADVCELLRVPAATIYQLTHRGRIPHFKIAARLRFRRSEILDWIEERRVRTRGSGSIESKRRNTKSPLKHSE